MDPVKTLNPNPVPSYNIMNEQESNSGVIVSGSLSEDSGYLRNLPAVQRMMEYNKKVNEGRWDQVEHFKFL